MAALEPEARPRPPRVGSRVCAACVTPQPNGTCGARHLPPEAAVRVPAVPRQVLSLLKGLAEPCRVIKRGHLPAYLCLAWSPGEGSVVQPWVLGVFILPKLPKGSAGREGNFILEPVPRGAFFSCFRRALPPGVLLSGVLRAFAAAPLLGFAFEYPSQLAWLAIRFFPFQRRLLSVQYIANPSTRWRGGRGAGLSGPEVVVSALLCRVSLYNLT